MQGGVAAVGEHAGFQGLAGFFQTAFGGVQHAQVVVRLDDARMGFDELAERFDGLVGLALLRLNHAFEKAQFGVLRQPLLFLLHQLGRLLELPGGQRLPNALCRR